MNISLKIIFTVLVSAVSIHGFSQSVEDLLTAASDSISERKLGEETLSLLIKAGKLAKPGSKKESQIILQKALYYAGKYDDQKVIETLRPRLRQEKDDTLRAKFNYYIGDAYIFLGNPDSAIHYLNFARNIFKDLKIGYFDIRTHRNLGNAYFNKLQEEIAFKEYDTAISLMAGYNDSSLYLPIMSNSAACLLQLNDLINAKKYYQKLIAGHSSNEKYIGRIYSNLGAVYSKQDSFQLAKVYFEKAIPYLENNAEMRILGSTYYNLIDVCLALGDPDKAIKYANLAEPLYVKHNPSSLGYLYNGLGNIYENLDSNKSALKFYLKALSVAKDAEQWREAESATRHLSEVYEKEGDIKQSLYFLKENSIYKDRIFETSKLEAIEKYRIKYEAEQQEQRIQQLEELNTANKQRIEAEAKTRIIYISLVAVGALLSILSIYIYGRFKLIRLKLEAAKKISELNNKIVLNRLNPHFIFNVLNSIQYFINSENKKKANHYLTIFATLLRKFMNSFSEDYHSLEEELALIGEYLELEKILNKDSFEFEIVVDDSVNQDLLIPTMIIQPLLENAIKHGTTSDKPLVQLRIKESKKYLTCIIEDNGHGMAKIIDTKNSKGLELIKERIDLLNITAKGKISINAVDKMNGLTGLKITLMLPK